MKRNYPNDIFLNIARKDKYSKILFEINQKELRNEEIDKATSEEWLNAVRVVRHTNEIIYEQFLNSNLSSIYSCEKFDEKVSKAVCFIPYVEEKFKLLEEQNKIKNTSIENVFKLINLDCTPITEKNGQPIENPYIDLINEAYNQYLSDEFYRSLPCLKSTVIKKHVVPNNKLANSLLNEKLFTAEGIELIVANKGKPNQISSVVVATLQNMEGLNITGKPYTEFDRQVHDAVVSLWVYGDKSHIITPNMIYRTMTHQTQSETPSPQQIGAITRSLNKMRKNISITVDATEEMKKRKIKDNNGNPIDEYIIDDVLISAKRIKVKSGGKTVDAFFLRDEPCLYTYAKFTKQIITIPAKLFDIKKIGKDGKITTRSVANTENRISIKGYLSRRIEIMRYEKKKGTQSKVILYSSIFEDIGIKEKRAQNAARTFIFQVLDFWKAKEIGYIKGYKERVTGRVCDAIVIEI